MSSNFSHVFVSNIYFLVAVETFASTAFTAFYNASYVSNVAINAAVSAVDFLVAVCLNSKQDISLLLVYLP